MADPNAKYRVQQFRAAEQETPEYGRSTAWVQAVALGFHQQHRNDEYLAKTLSAYRADNRELTGVYVDGDAPEHALAAAVPVATYATMDKPLNVGYGRQLDARLVTSVTVRGTHRRKGLLRGLITADLAAAKDEGLAVAALTVSEGAIYGRFGFGVATTERSITVDTGPRFRISWEATGTVEVAEAAVLLELAPQVFSRVHRHTPGSIGRQEFYRLLASGTIGRDGLPDATVRCALHYDAAGAVDGYVSYRFKGWDIKPYTMEIVDLVAATDAAYLELWQYLGSIDLIERIIWEEAPVEDPLTWALQDPRCIESSVVRDMLWLRILDARAALAARQYAAGGRLVLEIRDALGFASGLWVVESDDGAAAVAEAPSGTTPDLSMDVADLGAMFLGAVSPVTLSAAGRIREHTPGAAATAGRMFAVERPAHCLTHF